VYEFIQHKGFTMTDPSLAQIFAEYQSGQRKPRTPAQLAQLQIELAEEMHEARGYQVRGKLIWIPIVAIAVWAICDILSR
jgi:hypothetical protein